MILSAVVIFAGFGLVFSLSNFLERNRVSLPVGFEDSDLDLQGKRLKGFSLGAEGLIADWYWMRSLQYVGDKLAKTDAEFINIDDLRSLNPRLLYPFLDNATDLDPAFIAAYTYGAMVLPAIDPDKAILLIEKGIKNNPDYWRLYQYLGYIHWRLKDYDRAAAAYEKGSQNPNAAPFMKMMVASMKNQGGSRETARAIYQQMLDEARDEQTRNSATLRLMEIDSLEERDAIRTVLKDYAAKNGACPQSFRQIIPLLRSVKLPAGKAFHVDNSGDLADPSGAPYILDRQACEVKLDPERTKVPLM
jgi:tetratricopeptide (TPR) repeat protein